MTKRIISAILVVCFVLIVTPYSVFADEISIRVSTYDELVEATNIAHESDDDITVTIVDDITVTDRIDGSVFSGGLIVPDGVTVTIANGGFLESGIDISHNAIINIDAGGTLATTTDGNIINHGTITVDAGSEDNYSDAATLIGWMNGSVIVENDGTLEMNGNLIVSTFDESGETHMLFNNEGTIRGENGFVFVDTANSIIPESIRESLSSTFSNRPILSGAPIYTNSELHSKMYDNDGDGNVDGRFNTFRIMSDVTATYSNEGFNRNLIIDGFYGTLTVDGSRANGGEFGFYPVIEGGYIFSVECPMGAEKGILTATKGAQVCRITSNDGTINAMRNSMVEFDSGENRGTVNIAVACVGQTAPGSSWTNLGVINVNVGGLLRSGINGSITNAVNDDDKFGVINLNGEMEVASSCSFQVEEGSEFRIGPAGVFTRGGEGTAVSFHTNGGNLNGWTPYEEVVIGESILLPAPTKANKVFVGWQLIGSDDIYPADSFVPSETDCHTFIALFCNYGDISLDCQINTSDALLVLKYTVGVVELDDSQLALADYNQDGDVNTGDVVSMLQHCLDI